MRGALRLAGCLHLATGTRHAAALLRATATSLGASSAVEPALCAGVVPGEGNYDWQGTFCEARGHSALGTCVDVAAGVVAYCNLR